MSVFAVRSTVSNPKWVNLRRTVDGARVGTRAAAYRSASLWPVVDAWPAPLSLASNPRCSALVMNGLTRSLLRDNPCRRTRPLHKSRHEKISPTGDRSQAHIASKSRACAFWQPLPRAEGGRRRWCRRRRRWRQRRRRERSSRVRSVTGCRSILCERGAWASS